MIKGSGSLITEFDEDGIEIPFLTTEEILRQIMKFGFYVQYDVKKYLPTNILAYLATIDNLGYDKITVVAVEDWDNNGQRIWRPTVIVMKSAFNDDLLTYGCKVTRKVFNDKLNANVVVNVTHEKDMVWDWVTYIANIEDILNENVDPTNEFDPVPGPRPRPPFEFTEYDSEIVDDGDDRPIDQPGSVLDFDSESPTPTSPSTDESGIYGSEVVDEP